LPDLVFRGCAAMVVYSRFPPPPDAYAASARRQYRGSWPTAIVLVAHVPTTTPPERELHAGKGTSRALTTGAPVMSAYERTYVRALTPLAGTRVAAGPAGREASRQEVAGRVRQGARIFLQRVGEAADVGLKKSAASCDLKQSIRQPRCQSAGLLLRFRVSQGPPLRFAGPALGVRFRAHSTAPLRSSWRTGRHTQQPAGAVAQPGCMLFSQHRPRDPGAQRASAVRGPAK
jgi:hypothetical protein